MIKNSIYVSEISQSTSRVKAEEQTLYSHIQYDSNINMRRKKVNIGENPWYQYINFNITKTRVQVSTCNYQLL